MDSTDLNLWYRLGLTHSKLYQTDQAISAFLEVTNYIYIRKNSKNYLILI